MVSPEQGSKNVYEIIWGKIGITEHLGGIKATKQLIEACDIHPGQFVLDLGCGTGFTACLLAKEYGVNVVAADKRPEVIEWADKRIIKEGVDNRVITEVADAEDLRFPSGKFDAAICESVLIFTNKSKAASEIHRVLRPDGVFGDNELTFLRTPPYGLIEKISDELGLQIQPLTEDQWIETFYRAGFRDITFEVRKEHIFTDNILSHLQIDGIRKILSAYFNRDLWSAVLNKNTLSAYRDIIRLLPYIGYGLYVCRK